MSLVAGVVRRATAVRPAGAAGLCMSCRARLAPGLYLTKGRRGVSSDSLQALRSTGRLDTFPAPSSTSSSSSAAPVATQQPGKSLAGSNNGATPAASNRRLRRPQKAVITLTERALDRLRETLVRDEKMIKVSVKTKGCAGHAYNLEWVDGPGKFDEVVTQDGVTVIVDNKALLQIIGSKMDYVEDDLQARFVFENPNVKSECGCGESIAF